MHAHGRSLFRSVGKKKSIIRSGDERARIATAQRWLAVVDSQLIVAEIEHEFESPGREYPLAHIGGRIAVIQPEVLDEVL
jgi:hypothetical protein